MSHYDCNICGEHHAESTCPNKAKLSVRKARKMNPGDKVTILIDTWMAPAGTTGQVHTVNLTEGLISVEYDEPFQGVFDFAEVYLKLENPDG